jgi:hypothetical protein
VSCQELGGLRRQSRERAVQLKADPSARLLGCLSPGLLELFLVRSAEERERAARRRRRKAQRKMAAEGGIQPVDEADLRLTAAEEMPSLTSLSAPAKMRSVSLPVPASAACPSLSCLPPDQVIRHPTPPRAEDDGGSRSP